MADIKLVQTTYKECKYELIAFRNENRDIRRDEDYFNWRYLGRPHTRDPIIVWAEIGNEKIGSLSVIPHHFIVNKVVQTFGILGDISVSEKWRGKGIAQKMFKYLTALEITKELEALLVIPNREAARPLEKTNWRAISKLERFVKIIEVEDRLKRWMRVDWFSKLLARPLNGLMELLSCEYFLEDNPMLEGVLINEFDERFNVLWAKVEKEKTIFSLRNRSYLTWRYIRHPITIYQIFTLTSGDQLYGYIIFHYNSKVCIIDDILFIAKGNYAIFLFYYFFKYLKENRFASTIFLNISRNAIPASLLYKLGFIKRPDHKQIMVNSANAKNIDDIFSTCSVYVTLGDKDV